MCIYNRKIKNKKFNMKNRDVTISISVFYSIQWNILIKMKQNNNKKLIYTNEIKYKLLIETKTKSNA